MAHPHLRRVPGNIIILLAFTLLSISFFRPHQQFPQFDTSSLKAYLNGTHPMQKLQALAEDLDLTPGCEEAVREVVVMATATEVQTEYVTATETETMTCPVQAAFTPLLEMPIAHPPTISAEDPTPEQLIIARLRTEGITLIIKTGAQEVSHLSIQIGTTLRYLDPLDLLIFSDLQSSLGPFLIHDALRNVDQALKETDLDFAIYRDIRRYQRTGQDISELKEERAKGDSRAGWKLDKYKFLHMVEQTFEMRPGSKWYVFVETDSYVVWSNLAEWLSRLDSTKPIYLGAPVMLGGQAFAHGGSGYVLSNAAMNKLLGPDQPQGLAASWDKRMKQHCCGDLALAIALKEKGVDLTGAGPMTHGEKPATFSYGPGELWCQPVVTMHHVLPHEVSAIWRFERRREILDPGANETIFSDLYFHFVEPLLVDMRENWDNMAHGTTYSVEETEKQEAKWAKEDKLHEIDEEKEKVKNKEKVEADRKAKLIEEEISRNEKLKEQKAFNEKMQSEKPKEEKEKDEKQRVEEERLRKEKNEKAKEDKAKDEKAKEEKAKQKKSKGDRPKDSTKSSTPNQKLLPSAPKPFTRLLKRSTRTPLSPLEKAAHLSFEDCAKACTAQPECFQYVHGDKKCRLGHSFRLGKYAPPGKGDRIEWRSGWNLTRIRAWTNSEENVCLGAKWPDWVG
ncbi:hypothetical protein VTL71DRAFT_8863 [Oculimacula yallundae]|uniref:N-acetylgalactosaminide beta-1,3-galactosyltransferase n=1 Tax=Oculimacula yallundae TaxID=86028 RepID=A0ABR4BUM2_9HELO